MKFVVNESCIGCGMCEGICPDVFHLNDDGIAEAIDSDVEDTICDTAREALDACPVSAIEEA